MMSTYLKGKECSILDLRSLRVWVNVVSDLFIDWFTSTWLVLHVTLKIHHTGYLCDGA